MAYDEALAERIRAVLGKTRGLTDKRVVGGGLGFMREGKMFVGVMKNDLLVRVAPDRRVDVLKQPGVRPLRLGGKPTAAYLLVDPANIRGRAALRKWIELAATTLPDENAKGSRVKKMQATAAPDPRVRKLIETFRADPTLRAIAETFDASSTPWKFGSNGLKVNGKLFALFTQETLVVKLPKGGSTHWLQRAMASRSTRVTAG